MLANLYFLSSFSGVLQNVIIYVNMAKENIEFAIYSETNSEVLEKNMETPDLPEERRILERVEKLMSEKEKQIGKGTTAEVYFVGQNREHCYKIISRKHGTVVQTPKGSPKFHSLKIEGDFLNDLRGLDSEVRVPEPYFSVVRTFEDDDGENIRDEEISVLSLERLDAVSIADVLDGAADLPKSFNFEKFFYKLRKFFEKMHEEKHIFHRDAHAGNIMIDIKTGNPRVIDFGCSTFSTVEEAYTETTFKNGNKITLRYVNDDNYIEKVERDLRSFLDSVRE